MEKTSKAKKRSTAGDIALGAALGGVGGGGYATARASQDWRVTQDVLQAAAKYVDLLGARGPRAGLPGLPEGLGIQPRAQTWIRRQIAKSGAKGALLGALLGGGGVAAYKASLASLSPAERKRINRMARREWEKNSGARKDISKMLIDNKVNHLALMALAGAGGVAAATKVLGKEKNSGAVTGAHENVRKALNNLPPKARLVFLAAVGASGAVAATRGLGKAWRGEGKEKKSSAKSIFGGALFGGSLGGALSYLRYKPSASRAGTSAAERAALGQLKAHASGIDPNTNDPAKLDSLKHRWNKAKLKGVRSVKSNPFKAVLPWAGMGAVAGAMVAAKSPSMARRVQSLSKAASGDYGLTDGEFWEACQAVHIPHHEVEKIAFLSGIHRGKALQHIVEWDRDASRGIVTKVAGRMGVDRLRQMYQRFRGSKRGAKNVSQASEGSWTMGRPATAPQESWAMRATESAPSLQSSPRTVKPPKKTGPQVAPQMTAPPEASLSTLPAAPEPGMFPGMGGAALMGAGGALGGAAAYQVLSPDATAQQPQGAYYAR